MRKICEFLPERRAMHRPGRPERKGNFRLRHDGRIRCGVLGVFLCVALVWPVVEACAAHGQVASQPDTLLWVNGVSITTDDLDLLLESAHRSLSQEGMQNFDPQKLLDKAINDELLLQQAEALGLEEEPEIRSQLEEAKAKQASSFWIKDHYQAPATVSPDQLRSSYEVNYERIQLRQMSLRTKEEAEAARKQVLAGASMDSMARAASLDTKKLEGGLYHELPFLEISAPLLKACRRLQPGEISGVFPYNKAWSFVRIEKREPAPEERSVEAEETVRKILLGHQRKESWRAFMDSLDTVVPIREAEAVVAAIQADSTRRLTESFMKGSNEPALYIESGPFISDYELRQEISHQTMNDGTASFTAVFRRSVDSKKDQLILEYLTQRDGYVDKPEVRKVYADALRKTLIQAYLGEAIVPKIKFSHAEFQEYYDRHKEEWRGPDQVLLDIVVLGDKEQAEELAGRLKSGSDFDRIKNDYTVTSETKPTERSWASVESFNDRMQEAIAKMEVGDADGPAEISQGWMFFQLDGRRPGKVPGLEEMDSTIRGVMFQKKFNDLLDEHLDLLKSRSRIVRNETAIEAYLNPGS